MIGNLGTLFSPLTSVVIIFFDARRFLAEAIESVLEQTHRPIEILLIDDASTDGSRDIAEQYAARHPFIRVVQHEGRANRGMSASRNLGLFHARGRFVGFLDADDVWLPEKLAAEVPILRRHPRAAMVCSPTHFWFSWTADEEKLGSLAAARGWESERPQDFTRYIARGKIEGMVPPPRLLRRHLRRPDGLPKTTGALVRRSAALKVGGYENSFSDLFEDQVFFSKMALRYPVYVTREPYARYRQHTESACHRARLVEQRQVPPGELSPSHLDYLRWLAGYLRQTHPEFRKLRKTVEERLEVAGPSPAGRPAHPSTLTAD